jgi:HEAT repeat protein
MLRPFCCLLALLVAAPLFAATKDEEAKKYAADLKSKDPKVRATAAAELGKLGQIQKRFATPYVTDLINVLTDSDAKVRGESAKALGLIDPDEKKELVDKLAELLKAEKSEVARQGQERGLGELGATAEESDVKNKARGALREAQKKSDSKGEQNTIKAAMEMINGPKKKN